MAARNFHDDQGVEWSVVEVHPTVRRPGMVRPQFEHGWLLFVSNSQRRRLAPPPRAWSDMDEGALRRLLGAAEISTPARYPVRRLAD